MNRLNHTRTHQKTHQSLQFSALAILSLTTLFALQACGGGGGDNGGGVTPDVPTLSVAAASVLEGNTGSTGTADFVLTLSAAASSDVTVSYSTSDNTATTADSDYIASTGSTLVIPAGQVTATISITVTGDNTIELDERFNLQISNAQNASISGGSQTVTGTIQSDDSLAGYYTGDSDVIESGSPSTPRTGNIQVIADINRFSIIDLTNNFIYIATIDTFTSATSFTASARVYFEGNSIGTTAITADFVAGTSIDLSLSGTGNYSTGTVTLAYSPKNGDAALVFASGDIWEDSSPFTVGYIPNSNININITSGNSVPSDTLNGCRTTSIVLENILSEQQPGRIRSFSVPTVTICAAMTPLDGYLTSYDTVSADDTVLFIWFNDNGAHAAALSLL